MNRIFAAAAAGFVLSTGAAEASGPKPCALSEDWWNGGILTCGPIGGLGNTILGGLLVEGSPGATANTSITSGSETLTSTVGTTTLLSNGGTFCSSAGTCSSVGFSSVTTPTLFLNGVKVTGFGTGLNVGVGGVVTATASGGGAPLNSPAFTGTPTAPTAAPGTATTQVATTGFVGSAVTAAAAPAGEFDNTSSGGTLTYAAYVPRTAWPTAPSLTAGTPGDLTVSCSKAVGYYSRLGSRVTVDFSIVCTPTFTTASGNIAITGLPFSAASTNIDYPLILSSPISAFVWTGSTDTMLQPQVSSGSNLIQFVGYKSNTASFFLMLSSFTSGTAITLAGSGSYDTTSAQ